MTTDGYEGGLMNQQPGAPSAMRRVPRGARLVLATANTHKVAELRAILTRAIVGFDTRVIIGLGDLGLAAPVEDGVSFEENALLEGPGDRPATARPPSPTTPVLSPTCSGRPGVFSARWAGSHGDDVANLDLLLAQLADVPRTTAAHGSCAAAPADAVGGGVMETAEIRGSLLDVLLGDRRLSLRPHLPAAGERTLDGRTHRGREERDLPTAGRPSGCRRDRPR